VQGTVYHGHDGVRAYVELLDGEWEDMTVHADAIQPIDRISYR
jgi:hypothetical protein